MGVETVQLIGGEPTPTPNWPHSSHTLEVRPLGRDFSSLYRVGEREWLLFQKPGVRLATSSYSDDAAEHDALTGRKRSHACPQYRLGGPATGRLTFGVGMTFSPCRTHGLGVVSPAPEASTDR